MTLSVAQVKESDPLPKQVCWICLEKLNFCYNFNEAVAQAENQLRDFCGHMSTNVEEMESNCHEDTSKTGSDVEMQYESRTMHEEDEEEDGTKPYSILRIPDEARVRNKDGNLSSIVNERQVSRAAHTGSRTDKNISNTRRRKVIKNHSPVPE